MSVVEDCLKGNPALRPSMPDVLRRLGALLPKVTLQLMLPCECMALCTSSLYEAKLSCCSLWLCASICDSYGVVHFEA